MTTSVVSYFAEMVNDEYIVPLILDSAWNEAVCRPVCLEQDLRGKGSGVGSFLVDSAPTISGTADHAVAEGSSITPTIYNPSQTQVTAAEFGFSIAVTDKGLEDNIFGQDLLLYIADRIQRELQVSFDYDLASLMGSLTQDAGAVGTDLTVANMVEASWKVKAAGYSHDIGQGVYILHPVQAEHLDKAIAAVSTTSLDMYWQQAVGSEMPGIMGYFKRNPVLVTGNVNMDYGNTAYVGGYMVNAKVRPTLASIGIVQARDVTLRMDRSEVARTSTLVGTARWGAGVINGGAGCAINTDT